MHTVYLVSVPAFDAAETDATEPTILGRPLAGPIVRDWVAEVGASCKTRAMKELSPAYLSALAGQLGTLSAFLGGFAATFLATLLTLTRRDRLLTVCIGLSVTSAVAFIVTVVAATMVTAVNHPDAPTIVTASTAGLSRILMTLGFYLGTLSLLATLGCSGSLHSRGVGRVTAFAASMGALAVIAMTIRIN